MTAPPKDSRPRVVVRLRTRASRTRQRTEDFYEVEAPRTQEGQLNQLIEIVENHYPGAQLRVFNEGAGSFTREDLHVVAAYQGDAEVGFAKRAVSESSGEDDDGFEQLPLTA